MVFFMTNTENYPEKLRKLKYKFTYFNVIWLCTFALVETFLILYFLEYLFFIEIGVLLAIGMGVQTFTDYPTGDLGDYLRFETVE